jgi:uncharacterized protein
MTSTAIVTGYSSGLGRAITEQLLSRRWRVVGVSRKPPSARVEGGDRLIEVHGSVVDAATVERAFEEAARLGGARLVINCAGQGYFGEAGTYSVGDVMAALEGNLAGLIIFSDHAVKHMSATGGDIVNVMSTAAKKLRAAESVYTASKWGAKGYTRVLREAIKAQKLKIRVFEVYPCGMNTPFWKSAIRPVADGKSFPEPGPIAAALLNAVLAEDSSYQQEFTFERS